MEQGKSLSARSVTCWLKLGKAGGRMRQRTSQGSGAKMVAEGRVEIVLLRGLFADQQQILHAKSQPRVPIMRLFQVYAATLQNKLPVSTFPCVFPQRNDRPVALPGFRDGWLISTCHHTTTPTSHRQGQAAQHCLFAGSGTERHAADVRLDPLDQQPSHLLFPGEA